MKKRILIIGAGPGGIGMAIRLQQAGYEAVTIVEKANGVGGTWYHNRYPGAACDVQSALYSFSFAPKLDWTRPYATQPEILSYFEQVVADFDLNSIIRLGRGVESLRWSDDDSTWTATIADGESITADIVVSAIGMFNDVAWPAIDGLESFAGTLFHSARWLDGHDLTGERVAVIGAGASTIQLLPEVARIAGHLYAFQRTPQWVLPKIDVPYAPDELERRRLDANLAQRDRSELYTRIDAGLTFSDPKVLALTEDMARRNLEAVADPVLRHRLTPTDPYGCHRPLLSNEYFPAFNRPNVELVTTPIERVTADAIVTTDGTHRAVDTIIAATGFATTRYLAAIDVTGRDGRRLRDDWADGAAAYRGVTVAGYPNLFMLYGPNTNNGSILHMIECQIDYVIRHVEALDQSDGDCIEVNTEDMEAYNREVQARLDGIAVWNSGCSTYYRGPSGRIVTQWPGNMADYSATMSLDDSEAYSLG